VCPEEQEWEKERDTLCSFLKPSTIWNTLYTDAALLAKSFFALPLPITAIDKDNPLLISRYALARRGTASDFF
jgi:hypothetical protein